jgi:predicted nucleic acid-binding protein
MKRLRIVVDTNVIFEGLTKQGGAAGFLIDAWLSGFIDVYISNALAYEYVDVLSRKLSGKRWQRLKSSIGALLARAQFVPIYYTWRPISPDPQDDHVVDCAMNAGAVVVTNNVRDFKTAMKSLGLHVMTPAEVILLLSEEGE